MATKITSRDIQLSKRIRRLRRKSGLTQEQLADKVRISVTHIGLVETGKRRFSLKTLQKVAAALGIKTRDLLPF